MASTRKVGNVWTYRFSYKDQFGERKYIERGGFKSSQQAKKAGDSHEREFKDNRHRQHGELPVAEYFHDYIHTKKKQSVSPRTLSNYLNSLNHVEAYFKSKRMSDITNLDYQEFLNNHAIGRSKETIKKIHSHLSACFRYAHKNGHIPSDPSFDVHVWGEVPPKEDASKYLSKGETSRLINQLKDGLQPSMKSRHLLLLLIATGLRVGEAMALKADDFNFKDNTVRIASSYDYIETKKEVSTKNTSSNRTLAVDTSTMELIKDFIDHNQPTYFIFNNGNSPISHHAISKSLKKACKRAKVPIMTPHGLRHTHASLLLANRLDIFYISERLGHSSVNVTQTVYAHVIDELRQHSNKELNNLMDSLL